MRRLLSVMALCLGLFGLSSTALADVVLGVGGNGNVGILEDDIDMPSSWSLSGVVGYRLQLGALEVTPELEVTYLDSIGSLRGNALDAAYQIAGGARAGLALGNWVPSAYAHVGLGRLDLKTNEYAHAETGALVEVGAALDYRLADLVSVGVQVGCAGTHISEDGGQGLSWVRAGAYAALSL